MQMHVVADSPATSCLPATRHTSSCAGTRGVTSNTPTMPRSTRTTRAIVLSGCRSRAPCRPCSAALPNNWCSHASCRVRHLRPPTVVYSQVWDEMELEPILPTDNGLTCTIDEIDPGQKEALRASAGRRITVTLPPDLPEGYFHAPLVLRGRPRGGSAEQSADCELAVEGKVIRRLSVYGPEIDVHGTVDLGRIRQGNTAHVRLMLKLRDPERNLTVKRIETSPSFLRVSIEPHHTSDSVELGLYYLHIEVPKDAPTFHLPPTERGLIHVEFDHPRVAALDLPVDLIVIPPDGV